MHDAAPMQIGNAREFFGTVASRGREPRLADGVGNVAIRRGRRGTWTVKVDRGALHRHGRAPAGSPTARLELAEARARSTGQRRGAREPLTGLLARRASTSAGIPASRRGSSRFSPCPTTGGMPDDHQHHFDPRRQHVRRLRSPRRLRQLADRDPGSVRRRHPLPLEVGAHHRRQATDGALDRRRRVLQGAVLPRADERDHVRRRRHLRHAGALGVARLPRGDPRRNHSALPKEIDLSLRRPPTSPISSR